MSQQDKPPLATDATQIAQLRAQQLADDFEAVFAQPHRRSESQSRVLAHLAVCAGEDGNSYRFNTASDGVGLVAAGIHRDGARSILRVIDFQVAKAATLRVNAPKTKAKVKR